MYIFAVAFLFMMIYSIYQNYNKSTIRLVLRTSFYFVGLLISLPFNYSEAIQIVLTVLLVALAVSSIVYDRKTKK